MVESSKKPDIEDLQHFSKTRWIKFITNISANPERIDVETWVAFLNETTLLFKRMGNAMGFAFAGKFIFFLN